MEKKNWNCDGPQKTHTVEGEGGIGGDKGGVKEKKKRR